MSPILLSSPTHISCNYQLSHQHNQNVVGEANLPRERLQRTVHILSPKMIVSEWLGPSILVWFNQGPIPATREKLPSLEHNARRKGTPGHTWGWTGRRGKGTGSHKRHLGRNKEQPFVAFIFIYSRAPNSVLTIHSSAAHLECASKSREGLSDDRLLPPSQSFRPFGSGGNLRTWLLASSHRYKRCFQLLSPQHIWYMEHKLTKPPPVGRFLVVKMRLC